MGEEGGGVEWGGGRFSARRGPPGAPEGGVSTAPAGAAARGRRRRRQEGENLPARAPNLLPDQLGARGGVATPKKKGKPPPGGSAGGVGEGAKAANFFSGGAKFRREFVLVG
ncbi:hypothetical protein Zmor_010815 [Zophobas morio]|uniref:Uncharacterized protein n=1 Tax=Zophobas morio TaxID=2755281 RepID=A0AA38MKA2_9CUCU|nr:hypothetical protein Zmor_010815 [Zophobas morio]